MAISFYQTVVPSPLQKMAWEISKTVKTRKEKIQFCYVR